MCRIDTILVVFISLFSLSLVTMGDRYKSHYFKDFSGGEGQRFLSENNTKYHASSKIQVSGITKKIALQKDLVSNSLVDSVTDRNIATDGTYLYVVIFTGGAWKLYSSTDGESWSLIFTFAGTYTDNTRIGYKDGKLFIFFGSGHIAVSTDGGSSWTYTITSQIEVARMFVSYWAELDGYIYYQCVGVTGPRIVRTKDFVTIETVYEHIGDVDMEQLIEFDGFIYFVIENRLFRIEDGQPVRIRTFQDYPMIIPIGKEQMAIIVRGTSYSKTFLFDGASFQEFARLTGYTTGRPLFEAYGYAFFIMYNGSTYDIFKINTAGEIFKEYTDTGFMETGIHFKDYDIFMDYGLTVKKSKNYKLAGTLDLPIIDEGDIIPVALVVRHKPLIAGTAVNIYAKKDQAASWGTALLTSTTTSAVKKEYKFPNGGQKCSFVQLEIELTSNSSSNTPDDVSLEFIYLPAGLKNAK